ncbi:hypothetical protein [Arthrobacter sp. 92]|uniref:hypothetical protein n=1 Tax=Arthrobacter sp. 92 TaxID=3418175 RepID=UPI003CFF6702
MPTRAAQADTIAPLRPLRPILDTGHDKTGHVEGPDDEDGGYVRGSSYYAGGIERRPDQPHQLPAPGTVGDFFVVQPALIRGPRNAHRGAHPADREFGVLLLNKPVEVLIPLFFGEERRSFFRKSFSLSSSRSRASNALYFAIHRIIGLAAGPGLSFPVQLEPLLQRGYGDPPLGGN